MATRWKPRSRPLWGPTKATTLGGMTNRVKDGGVPDAVKPTDADVGIKADAGRCFRRPRPVCQRCGSDLIRKNGHAENGDQRTKCLACGRTFVLQPKGARYDAKFKDQVVAAYQDRMSNPGHHVHLRGVRRDGAALGGEKAASFPAFVAPSPTTSLSSTKQRPTDHHPIFLTRKPHRPTPAEWVFFIVPTRFGNPAARCVRI